MNGLDIDLSGGKLITEGGDDLLGQEVEHQPEGDGDGQSGQGAPKMKIIFQQKNYKSLIWMQRIPIHVGQRIKKWITKK